MKLIDLVNSVVNSNDLTLIVNFPTQISDCDPPIPALLDLFLLMLVFVLQWLSLHWEILNRLLSQFPLTFHQTHNRMPYFIAQFMTTLVLIGTVFVIFKLSASAAASKFCEWIQVGTDVYIPHCKYQVEPHTSPWFSAASAAALAIVYRNHFFRLYQQNKSSESKVKFRQASRG